MIYETLHICNTDENIEIDCYKNLITDNDAVVFFMENMSKINHQELLDLYTDKRIYFLIESHKPTIDTINYNDFLNLINQYNKTFTWR